MRASARRASTSSTFASAEDDMTSLIDEIRAGGSAAAPDPAFPHAPEGWTRARALDEKFHRQGGIRRLYLLFPGGPVAQGCPLAGLKAPAGATDRGFGSVA